MRRAKRQTTMKQAYQDQCLLRRRSIPLDATAVPFFFERFCWRLFDFWLFLFGPLSFDIAQFPHETIFWSPLASGPDISAQCRKANPRVAVSMLNTKREPSRIKWLARENRRPNTPNLHLCGGTIAVRNQHHRNVVELVAQHFKQVSPIHVRQLGVDDPEIRIQLACCPQCGSPGG
jgi:hypothetical protein